LIIVEIVGCRKVVHTLSVHGIKYCD